MSVESGTGAPSGVSPARRDRRPTPKRPQVHRSSHRGHVPCRREQGGEAMTASHGAGALSVRCACGWEWSGNVEAIVAATQEHDRSTHGTESSREEVLAKARPTDDAGDAGASESRSVG